MPPSAVSEFFRKHSRQLALAYLFCVGIGVAVLLYFIGHNAIAGLVLVCFLFLPWILGIAAVSEVLWALTKWPLARGISLGCVAIALTLISQLIGTFLFRNFAADSPQNSMANCERLVPYLDRYQVSEGRYPHSLIELDQFSALPKNIDTGLCEYLGKGDEFTLVTNIFFKGYSSYDADRKEWTYVD